MQEKIVFYNRCDERIAGIIENDISKRMIILLHGFTGDKEENGLFTECADYFAKKRLNTFRFDVSGIGESQGDFRESSLEKQAADLDDAIKFLRGRRPDAELGLIGFSLGATVALQYLNPNISAYSFWSPAFFPWKDMSPRYDTRENRIALRKQGYIEKNGVKVGGRILQDIGHFDASTALSVMDKPVQIIHGKKDPKISYQSSIDASGYLNEEPDLVLIDEANHSFKNNADHRNSVFIHSADFFLSRLLGQFGQAVAASKTGLTRMHKVLASRPQSRMQTT